MIDVTQLPRTSRNSIIPTILIQSRRFIVVERVRCYRCFETDLFDRVHFHFFKISIDEPILSICIQSCRWAIMWRNWGTGKRKEKKKGKKTNETKMESLLQITREMFRSFVFANGRQLRLFTWNWMKITPLLERCTIELNKRVSMTGEKEQRNWQIYNGKEWKKNVVGVMRISLVILHTVSVYT